MCGVYRCVMELADVIALPTTETVVAMAEARLSADFAAMRKAGEIHYPTSLDFLQ